MRMQFTGDSTAQTAFKMADTYMASGHWEAAESLLREYCTEQADLNLRLAQLEWRRQCAEYASGLDWDTLGDDGVRQALTSLEARKNP
jgi:Tfp pilus assembly protein PilV